MRHVVQTHQRSKPIAGHTVVASTQGPTAVVICSQLGQVRSDLSGGDFELVPCVQGDCEARFCWASIALREKLERNGYQVIACCRECAIEARTIPPSFV